jgi:putative ABC transport system permease protein
VVLTRKLLRELARAKGQTAAVLTVTGVGVLLFVASAAAYQDLRDSYARTQRELALAGLHVDVTRATPDDVRRAAALPGVQEADARAVAELPAAIGDHRVALRVLSLPDSGQPRLDRVLVLSGKLPTGPSEILLEKHLAQHHHLAAGDSIAIASGGVRRSLTVSGVGESAEYLWVTRNENDIFPDPDAFGVAWMRRGSLRALAAALLPGSPGLPGLAIAADDDSSNQLLLDPAAPSDDAAALSALKASLGPDAVLAATPAAKLPGIRLLEMDVDGYKQMAAFFPIFFLGVAAFILASILARLVDAQRPIIGTFAALGVGRARLLGHYLAFALVLGGAGALLGALASIPLSPAMTRAYAEDLGIPFVASRMHWDLVAYGLVTALAVAFLAGLVPALHASGLPPAEAMRPPRPSAGPLAKAARRLGGPLSLRLATRDLLGRPLRSLSTTVGVAAALVLVLATGGLLDSMATTLDAIFGGSRRYDVRVDLAAPEPLAAVQQRFSALAGVARLEGLVAAPASLSAGTHTAAALLQGLPAGSTLLRSLDLDGQVVDPAPGGVVLTRALARSLGVKPGDTVRVRMAPLPVESSFRVTGFADAALGKTATVGLADLQRDFAMGGEVTSVALKAAPGQAAAGGRAVS